MRKILLYLLLIGHFYIGIAQSECNVQIRSSFDSECMLTAYPEINPKISTTDGEISVLQTGGYCDYQACRGNTVIYYAETQGDVIAYEWNIIGASDYEVSNDETFVTVTWGDGSLGSVSVNIITASGNTCSSVVSVQLNESPFVGSSTVPPYYIDVNGRRVIEVCIGQSIDFMDESESNDSPITAWYWYDNHSGRTASTPNYTIEATHPGSFKIEHHVYNECGCVSKEEYILNVLKFDVEYELSCYGTVCANSTQEYKIIGPECDRYHWWVEGGFIINGQGTNMINVQWENPEQGYGIITLDLSQCDVNCNTAVSFKIPIIRDNVEINGSEVVCVGNHEIFEVPLWGSTAYYWEISPSENVVTLSQHTNNQYVVQFDRADTYTLNLRYICPFIDCGSFYAQTKTIVVKDYLHISSSNGNTVCQGDTLIFNTTPQVSANWKIYDSNGTLIFQNTSSTLTYPFNTAGLFIVKASHINYCETEYTVTVRAKPDQITLSEIDYKSEVCLYEGVHFSYLRPENVSNAFYVEWVPECPGMNIVNNDEASYVFAQACQISVYLVNNEDNNCRSTPLILEIDTFELAPVPLEISACVGETITISDIDQEDVIYDWWVLQTEAASLSHNMDAATTILINRLNNNMDSAYSISLILKRTHCNDAIQIDTITLNVAYTFTSITAPDSICQNNVVTISATGNDMNDDHYRWEIEGEVLTGKNIDVSFMNAGWQQINLYYLHDDQCETMESQHNIYVKPALSSIVTHESTTSGEILMVTYDNLATYQWYMNDEPVEVYTHTYAVPDTGRYCCIITFYNGCSSEGCFYYRDINGGLDCYSTGIDAYPLSCNRYGVALRGDAASLPTTWSVSASGGFQIVDYEWVSNNLRGVEIEFTHPGIYHVTATVTINNLCHKGIVPITISKVPRFSISYDCDSLLIYDNSLYLNPESVETPDFECFIGGNEVLVNPTDSENIYSVQLPYIATPSQLIVNMSIPGCDTLSKEMTIFPLPVVNSITVPTMVCANTPFQVVANGTGITDYYWDFGDGSSTRNVSPYHSYAGNLWHTVSFYGKNPNGCTTGIFMSSINVTSNPLDGIIVQDPASDTLCFGSHYELAHLGSESDFYYTWLPEPNNNHTYSHYAYRAGTYIMTVENPDGCQAQGRKNVIFKSTPVAQITGSTFYCRGDTVKLNGNVGSHYEYSWHFTGSNDLLSTEPNLILSSLNAGSYTIVLEVQGIECTGYDTINIRVYPPPQTPRLEFASDPCETPVQITSDDNDNLYWSFGAYGDSVFCYMSGLISAYQIDFTSGCKSKKDSIFIDPAPNFDALLTGCYVLCKNDLPAELPVYSFMPSMLEPNWEWHWLEHQNWSGVGSVMNLPVPGEGLYELETHYGEDCMATSPILDIKVTGDCPCKTIVKVGKITCAPKGCDQYIHVSVKICNSGTYDLDITDIFTNSANNIIGYSPVSLAIRRGECKEVTLTIQNNDFLATPIEVIIHDRISGCESEFMINFDPIKCLECEREIELKKLKFNEELSTPHQNSYFNFTFSLPASVSYIHSFWSEPPYILDCYIDGNGDLSGLYMINYGALTQMADNNENICFYFVVCISNIQLCLYKYCVKAKSLLDIVPLGFRSIIAPSDTPPIFTTEKEEDMLYELEVEKLYLAPNPTQNEVRVLGIDSKNIKEIMVLDMNGKQVQKTNNNYIFHVGNMPAGTYIIRIITTENKTHYLKLVKQ